ncbi:MAG: restriction endonuclease subunit M [Candidatus Yonathbacteria bacterium RIFOXYC2_FULL_47_9]|nr:MAG: restriction endonuclease subunit M [Candidatus Yonathbacteria bacterium RIFOXYC2_FULL_47_9]HAT68558.1 restriction endonuclease subunit M [Candidatus Yonathbacteria bacterium]
MENFNQKTSMIWNIADILRGGWKQHEYQDVILPLVVLKRLDSILVDTKAKVLEKHNEYKGKVNDLDPILKRTSGVAFYNISDYDFKTLLGEPALMGKNFKKYIAGYSQNIQDIFEKFEFNNQLERLEGGNLLFHIIQELNKVDLHPKAVDNYAMGHIFEELLRKFSEMSNETAGEHYTPRDVISLMAELLLEPDKADLKRPHVIKKIYDPACGTGGMLTVAKDYILEHINKEADIYLYGQELNSVTYAMAKSDMLIKGENPDLIRGGEKDTTKASTLSNDQFLGEVFDYGISNPPYGVDWKKDKEAVEREASRGHAGRFGAGLPRISDGQLLFLEHLVSKMKPEKDGGSRIAIVHNGSPLFTGDAGSGESEIRRWLLEKDLLEAIVALPDQLFYNTGINTYLWFISNRKPKERKGKVQLIDGRTFFKKTRKSLGSKRHEIDTESKKKIFDLYTKYEESEYSKVFNTTEFAYRQIQVERPLRLSFQVSDAHIEIFKTQKAVEKLNDKEREAILAYLASFPNKELFKNQAKFLEVFDSHFKELKMKAPIKKAILDALSERSEDADVCLDASGKPEADSELRDHENVPWGIDVNEYLSKEVKPYVSDAWINESVCDAKDGKVGIVGYEIPFTRYFYKYEAPRSLEAIETDIEKVENELLVLLKQL